MSDDLILPGPSGYRRPTSDELRELIRWGIKQGLLTWPTPPPPDLSPDIKKLRVISGELDRAQPSAQSSTPDASQASSPVVDQPAP